MPVFPISGTCVAITIQLHRTNLPFTFAACGSFSNSVVSEFS